MKCCAESSTTTTKQINISMGKKHAQPEPIDIFNAPSPRTLLVEGGVAAGRKRPRETSARTVSVSSPNASKDGLGFPESPPPEQAFDFGDRKEGDDDSDEGSDAFSSDLGDDGNVDEESIEDESEGTDSDEEGAEESEEGEEVGGRSGGSESGDESEGGDPDNITVHFEAVEMSARDVESVTHLMDQVVPDHRLEVDRDALGALLAASPFTTLVKLGTGDDSDEEGDEDSESDTSREVYGMVSLINVAAEVGVAAHRPALEPLLQLLKAGVWQTVAPGIAPVDLLTATDATSGKSKAMWLISEHIRTVPLELVSRLLAFVSTDLASQLKASSSDPGSAAAVTSTVASRGLNILFPCMFVLLAKIQRDAHIAKQLSKHAASPKAPKSAKTETRPLNIENEFIFWREEDEIMYKLRDQRVAVHAYRCRSQYDNQPESERPVTLAFAISSNDLQRALAEIAKRESIKPI